MHIKDEIQIILNNVSDSASPDDIINGVIDLRNQSRLKSQTKSKIRRTLSYESEKKDGIVLRVSRGKYVLRKKRERELREHILAEIKQQGFKIDSNNSIQRPKMDCKESIRNFHTYACSERYKVNKKFLNEKEDKLIKYFADGDEVDIDEFQAKLQVVKTGSNESDLFRYATLLWSVPVSYGFGRRVRFLIWDKNIDRLVGIFALGDPVFNLKCRDDWIHWDYKMRMKRLYNVMDVFVLGAVPPYNTLLGGKLVALCAASNETREIVRKRYSKSKTIIQGKRKDSRLALLTTGSALGRSSLYDRIKFNGRIVYQRIGQSEGWGHFHLNHELFKDMLDYIKLTNPDKAYSYHFGEGPNWKIRTAKICLKQLGLPEDLLKHGINREIYAIPLAQNYNEFLRGNTNELIEINIPINEVIEYWKDRWLIPRAKRKPEFKKHKRTKVSKKIHTMDKSMIK